MAALRHFSSSVLRCVSFSFFSSFVFFFFFFSFFIFFFFFFFLLFIFFFFFSFGLKKNIIYIYNCNIYLLFLTRYNIAYYVIIKIDIRYFCRFASFASQTAVTNK